MRLRHSINAFREVGCFPLLLVLFLVVRVAVTPVLQCQHELATIAIQKAKAAAFFHHSQDICGLPATDPETDGTPVKDHRLATPCPLFGATGVMPDCAAPAVAIALSVSRIYVSLSDLSYEGDDVEVAYNPRAPPQIS